MSNKTAIAYTITLPSGEGLEVKASANAWWMNRQKLSDLIAAFSISATTTAACSHAGITLKQYKYFVRLHPEFVAARDAYRNITSLKALKNIVQAIHDGDTKTSRWWSEKRMPEQFGKPSSKIRRLKKPKKEKRQEPELTPSDQDARAIAEKFEKELRLAIIKRSRERPD